MSYVAKGKTYDEGGEEIDAYGNHTGGGLDPERHINQPMSANAAAGGTTVDSLRGWKAPPNPYAPSTPAPGSAGDRRQSANPGTSIYPSIPYGDDNVNNTPKGTTNPDLWNTHWTNTGTGGYEQPNYSPPYLPSIPSGGGAPGGGYRVPALPRDVQTAGGAETMAPGAQGAGVPLPPGPDWKYDPNTGALVYTGGTQGGMTPDQMMEWVRTHAQGTNQNPTPGGGGGGDWIDQALREAESTDDPNYWRGVIAKDPKVAAGDQSAIEYWKHRIAIGDGARSVREGRTKPFQDGPGYGGPGATTNYGPKTVPGYAPLPATQSGTANDAVAYLNNLSHQMGGGDLSQAEIAQYAKMVGYVEGQPVSGAMVNQIAASMMSARGFQPPGGMQSQNPGATYDPTNPFDDPATKNYIDLLNERIKNLLAPRQDPAMDEWMRMIRERTAQLQTPYTNPDAAPLQDWMRKYFEQLQSPTYTDAQRGTLQTQALDPMERQRQVELKNVANVMASRGITPGSGPYLAMERDINQKYDALRAQTQAGLGVNEINQVRADQGQAANVGGALASFTRGQFDYNEDRANQGVGLFGQIPQMNLQEFNLQDNRANQAVNLARQIPDLAQSRINGATQLLQGSNMNPAQLLQMLTQFQQQGIGQSNQDGQFWSALIASIAKAFGL